MLLWVHRSSRACQHVDRTNDLRKHREHYKHQAIWLCLARARCSCRYPEATFACMRTPSYHTWSNRSPVLCETALSQEGVVAEDAVVYRIRAPCLSLCLQSFHSHSKHWQQFLPRRQQQGLQWAASLHFYYSSQGRCRQAGTSACSNLTIATLLKLLLFVNSQCVPFNAHHPSSLLLSDSCWNSRDKNLLHCLKYMAAGLRYGASQPMGDCNTSLQQCWVDGFQRVCWHCCFHIGTSATAPKAHIPRTIVKVALTSLSATG